MESLAVQLKMAIQADGYLSSGNTGGVLPVFSSIPFDPKDTYKYMEVEFSGVLALGV